MKNKNLENTVGKSGKTKTINEHYAEIKKLENISSSAIHIKYSPPYIKSASYGSCL